jgi:hypothetical protein
MARVPHPEGLSCTWLSEPPGLADPKRARGYGKGRKVIEACRAALRQGKKPPPTPPEDEPYPHFRFDFSSRAPQPRTFCVEMIDYSGELIDPNTSKSELAAKLRRHLCEVDALLVLAEAPRPGQEGNKLHEEFELLKQAFAMLRNERSGEPDLRLPVALLLNKWDRRYSTGVPAIDRKLQVEEFLHSHLPPPQADLVNALRGAVAPGCFRCFAASAFGESRTGDYTDPDGKTASNVELPPQKTPLPSFGLEDPFIWAARQRDALDVSSLKSKADELPYCSRWPWLYTNLAAFWPPWSLCHRASRLAQRFPRGGEPPIIREVRKRARKIAIVRTVTAAAVVLICLLVVEAFMAGVRYRQVESHLTQPDRPTELLVQDEQWLEAYATAPGYRHLLSRFSISRAEARRLLGEARHRREYMLWSRVDAASDDLAKEEPAKVYLAAFSNGKYALEANQVLQRAEDTRRLRENQNHLDGIARDLQEQRTKGYPDPEQLRSLDKRLQELPHPRFETDEQYRDRKKLSDDIGAARLATSKRDLRGKYMELMNDGRLCEAGALLARQPSPPKELLAEFPIKALEWVEKKCNHCLADKDWRNAQGAVEQLTIDSAVTKLLAAEDLKRLQHWQRKVCAAEDRDLYEQLRQYKDLRRAQRYLEAAPVKAMQREAQNYKEYLLQKEREISLTLHLIRIDWGDARNGGTEYTVWLNNQKIMEGQVTAKENTTSNDIAKASIMYKLEDGVKLDVHAKYLNDFYWTRLDYGTSSWEGKVRQLDGISVTMKKKEPPPVFCFALEGLPREPELPPYRQD